MAEFNKEKIKKLKRGELCGTLFTYLCGAALVYFMTLIIISLAKGNVVLQTLAFATGIPLMIIGIAVAAFCNLKYGRALDREIKQYVVDVFVENAAAMHPEKRSLSFFVESGDTSVAITVNGFKDKIVFDFSVFGKLSATRKLTMLTIIDQTLCSTFCRLYERGIEFTSVDYRETGGKRRQSGRVVPIIVNGVPETKIYKTYLKTK